MARKPTFTEPDQEILDTLLEETDRGCVLAAHGYIDKQLEELLRLRFRILSRGLSEPQIEFLMKGSRAPIASFYVKASALRATGTISSGCFDCLEGLNNLRNHFAHHAGKVRLTRERAFAIYDALQTDPKLAGLAEFTNVLFSGEKKASRLSKLTVAKDIFVACAGAIIVALRDKTKKLERKALAVQVDYL